MFCHQCGCEVNPGDQYCLKCGATLASAGGSAPQDPRVTERVSKEDLLREVEQALAQNSRLSVSQGPKSDLEIKSVLADAKWLLGRRKVEFAARVEAKQEELTVFYWEMVKESGWGLPTFGGFQVERYRTGSKTRSGSLGEVGYGPHGKMIDYDWDYAETRRVVEAVVKASGWKFVVTLRPSKAMH